MTVPVEPPQLLVLDVDGTLLEADGTLPEHRAEALAAISGDVPVMFATGKTWPSIAPLAARFDLEGPHLTCNGAAAVSLSGDCEILGALEPAVVEEILAALERRGIPAATYLSGGSSVTSRWDPGFDHITRVAEAPPEVAPIPADQAVLKILAVVDPDDEGDLRRVARDRAHIQRTSPRFLEWNAPGTSKGHGLELFAGRHGHDLARVVAVGDSENDVSMFRVAGLSVAVSSASETARAGADVHLDEDIATWLGRVHASVRDRPAVTEATR